MVNTYLCRKAISNKQAVLNLDCPNHVLRKLTGHLVHMHHLLLHLLLLPQLLLMHLLLLLLLNLVCCQLLLPVVVFFLQKEKQG